VEIELGGVIELRVFVRNQQGTSFVDRYADRPARASPFAFKKPVTKSSALPFGPPPLNGTNTTL
jgi:hypothetical protein